MTTHSTEKHQPSDGEGRNAASSSHERLAPPRPQRNPEVMGSLALSTPEKSPLGMSHKVRQRVGLAVAGAVLAGGAGTAVALSGSHEHAASPEPGASAPATPGTTEPSPSETSNQYIAPSEVLPPKSVTNNPEFEALAPDEQAKIKEYDAMTIVQFNQLDVKEQLKYDQFYIDVNKAYGDQQIDKKISMASEDPDSAPDTDEVSSGQDILDSTRGKQAVARWSLSRDGNPYHIDVNDPRKLSVTKVQSLLYDPNQPNGIYNSAVDIVNELDALVYDPSYPNRSDGNITQTAMKESATFKGPTGELTKIINVLSDGTDQYTEVMTKFTDAEGKSRNAWRVTNIVSPDDPTQHFLTDQELANLG